jgi:hypothetical protein
MKTDAIERCIRVTEDEGAEWDVGQSDNGYGNRCLRPVADARTELDALKAELTRLRALLASGQVVDLARVDAAACHGRHFVSHGLDMRVFLSEGGTVREWLIEKAGVKA